MSKTPHIVRLNPSVSNAQDTSTPRANLSKLTVSILQTAESELLRCLNEMLDSADDKLFDMADKSNEVTFFNAMRQVRIKRQGLINTFKQEFNNTFISNLALNDPQSFSENIEHLSSDSFTLVLEDDLEEDLALDAMVHKARAKYASALGHLLTRLDTICIGVHLDDNSNPLDPRAICEAFRTSSRLLELDIQSRLIVFKLFDRFVIGQLDEVYNELNAEFAENGILPDLHKVKPRRQLHQSSPRRRASDSSVDNEQSGAELGREEIREEVFNTLRDLLSDRKVAYSNQPPVINTDQLVSALNNLQHDQGFSAHELTSVQNLKSIIGGMLPATGGMVNGGTIGSINDDVIDIVTLLFDFILEDKNLHNEVKTLLSRLQIPMLKVGLVDRNFFSNKKHPARLLLNELAHLGIGWSPNKNASRDPLFEQINRTVERIIGEYKSDVALFNDLMNELEQFKESDSRRVQILEQRMREAEEGKARSETAKKTVNAEIQRICHGRVIAEPVKQVLKEAWTNVLFLESLKPDAKESYDKAIKVAEFLVWSVQPKKTPESLEKLKKIMPSLIKNLKLGMEKISFNPYRSSQLLELLEDCHRQIILTTQSKTELKADESPITPLESERETLNLFTTETVTATVLQELSLPTEESAKPAKKEAGYEFDESILDQNDLALQQVEQLQAGTWCELYKTPTEKRRCKLAAYIASSNSYIFVNRTGMKVADLSNRELAAGIKMGTIVVLDDAALFDRALESVITNLRAMKEA